MYKLCHTIWDIGSRTSIPGRQNKRVKMRWLSSTEMLPLMCIIYSILDSGDTYLAVFTVIWLLSLFTGAFVTVTRAVLKEGDVYSYDKPFVCYQGDWNGARLPNLQLDIKKKFKKSTQSRFWLFYLADGANTTQRARVELQHVGGGLLFTGVILVFCCIVTFRFIYRKSTESTIDQSSRASPIYQPGR